MAGVLARCLLNSARLVGNGVRRRAFYYTRPKKKSGLAKKILVYAGGVVASATAAGVYILGRPEPQIEGMKEIPDKYKDEPVIKAYLLRSRDVLVDFKNFFTNPAHEKLLPDLLPPPYQRPYTLILEMNDILVHSEYDRSFGWKYQKRPGLDKFFDLLFDHFEIVVFTSEPPMNAAPLLDATDTQQFIMYRLYRESTNYRNGHHVKDLTDLNRGLSRVIVIDTDPQSIQMQPENGLIVKKWTGDVTDTLLDLAQFLLTIANSGVDDVRPVIQFYKDQGGEYFLETFRINQARLQDEEKRRLAELQNSKSQFGGFSTFRARSGSTDNVNDTNSENESWASWLGSWVGLK